MKLAASTPVDELAEGDLRLLLRLLDEEVDGRPYGASGRINVREALLRRVLSAGNGGKANAAMLLGRERDFFTPLRERYRGLDKQSVRPLWRYSMGRVLQVPPGLECDTVTRWLSEGITVEQMLELERLHAINDQRCENEKKRSRPAADDLLQAAVHQIELPRKPTQAEIEEEEAEWRAANNAVDKKTQDAASPKPLEPSDAGGQLPGSTGLLEPDKDVPPAGGGRAAPDLTPKPPDAPPA